MPGVDGLAGPTATKPAAPARRHELVRFQCSHSTEAKHAARLHKEIIFP